MRCSCRGLVLALLVLFGVARPAGAQVESRQIILFGLTQTWRFNQVVPFADHDWTMPSYDDSFLPAGAGVLAFETNNVFVTSRTNTVLALDRVTSYFRTPFLFTNVIADATLVMSNIVDDGAVFYLNGVEVHRVNLPAAPAEIGPDTLASPSEPTSFNVVRLSGPIVETNLVVGTNILAVEVHQERLDDTDVAFGMALSAVIPGRNPPATVRMPQDPPSFPFQLTNAFGSLTFTTPVAIVSPPGETNRLFVVEWNGRISVITNLAQPTRSVFLDIATRVVASGEQGLLGLAFHPGYATNRQFYIFYTTRTTSALATNTLHDRLSRLLVSENNPNVADSNTETVLLEQRDEASNHNGGDLHFGPDGYLYVSLGDEGGGGDTYQNSQRIDKDFFSGLLRLDVDNRPDSLPANPHPANTNNPNGEIRYRIPPDNPWLGATTFNGAPVDPANVRTEFYAVGLRNPWRFTFDRATGALYAADVGQNAYEEVNIIRRGGNYGWSYREGLHSYPRPNPPAGVIFDQPVLEYAHGSGVNQGNSVTGGVVYRGNRLPMLYGAYVFADYEIGNVWMMRVNGTNVVPLTRLTREEGIAAFGVDPRNGDVLTAHIGSGMVKRLVEDTNQLTGTPVPPTLFQTGAFTNLMALTSAGQPLTPNVGVAPYDLNVPFWSDHAQKSRWVFRPNSNARFVFSRDGNWLFPTGTVWVKHFELELTNGMPSSTKRLETRLLVKNPLGVYGVTYRWGDSLTNATLVPEEGLDEEFTIYDAADGGIVRTQVWHYPGRSECLVCHTPAAGFALGFNTAQLNREVDFGRGPTNQLAALASSGYFNAPLVNRLLLPALAHATNSAWSREWRVRSFLAANCAQCHQPGGTALGSWDARYQQPLSLTGLLYGRLNDDWGDVNHRVIVPGSVSNSMLLSRLLTRGAGQMPPLASTQHDTQAIALLSEWITNDLAGYRTFSEWQTAHFGAPTASGADAAADPDLDGAGNYLEWLTGTNPLEAADFWSIGLNPGGNSLQVLIPQLANRGFELQVASSLGPNANWVPLNLPENRPIISSSNRLVIVEQPLTNPAIRFYRVRVFEP